MELPEKKTARLSDVARLSQVSSGLVSRIINKDPKLKIRDETRRRVHEAIEMLNYAPDASARALRNSRSGLLGFVLHHVNDPVYEDMVVAAQSAATTYGYSLILVDALGLEERREVFRQLVHGRRVDGLLVQSGFGQNRFDVNEFARVLPSVVFNSGPSAHVRTVRLDDIRACRMATEHLIDQGHTAIGFVAGVGSTSERRYQGYVEAMKRAGLDPLPQVLGGWGSDESHSAVREYYSHGGNATGLIAVTSTVALGVHSGILSSGLSIPGDVSLVGVHDTQVAKHLNPTLTTVSLPMAKLGAAAVSILIEQIESEGVGEYVITDPEPQIIVRNSTSTPERHN